MKPIHCPHCGSKSTKVTEYGSSFGYMVECLNRPDCQANSGFYDSEAEAITAWNRRDGCQQAAETAQGAA